MKDFWTWFVSSGRIDGQRKPWRRVLLVVVLLLLIGMWALAFFELMPIMPKNFFVRAYSNPFVIIAFIGIYLSIQSIEYLRHRIAAAGQEPPERGAIAQNDSKICEMYKSIYGVDSALRLPLRLGIFYMCSWVIAAIIMFRQGPLR